MSTSENRENSADCPPKSDKNRTEKPKSSPARKVLLLLLLVATIIVVGLEYLPDGESETNVVGPPAKKLQSPGQSPAQSPRQQPATPKQPVPQPKASPSPTPPQYERPPQTIFVSNSPSDQPAMAGAPTVSVTETIPAPMAVQTDPAPPIETPPVPADTAIVAEPSPPVEPTSVASMAQAKAADVTPPPTETAAVPPVEPAPVTPMAQAKTDDVTPPPVAIVSPPTTPTPEIVPSPELVASRSPTPALPAEIDSDPVGVVEPLATLPQLVARPMPEGPIPTKVNRYARRLFNRYDTNGDGLIDATEQGQMQGDPTATDYDADGSITVDELAAYTADFGRHRRMRLTGSMVEEAVADLPSLYIPTAEREAMAAQAASQQAQALPVALVDQAVELDAESADEATEPEQPQPATTQASSKRFVTPKSRLAGLPAWFLSSDLNGDGQLTVAEYAPNSEKARLATFALQDRNNDGVLTAQECPKK